MHPVATAPGSVFVRRRLSLPLKTLLQKSLASLNDKYGTGSGSDWVQPAIYTLAQQCALYRDEHVSLAYLIFSLNFIQDPRCHTVGRAKAFRRPGASF